MGPQVMMSIQAQSSIDESEDNKSTKVGTPNKILHEFVSQREPAFRRLDEIREKVILLPTIAGTMKTEQ
jgi:hypothetical protein